MLLLSRNILCCVIRKGYAQYIWDAHIVNNSKGDVGGVAPRATPRHTGPTMGSQPPLTSWNIEAHSPRGCGGVSSGSNCRLISVGPLAVSRMAREVRSKPSVRNNLTTSL